MGLACVGVFVFFGVIVSGLILTAPGFLVLLPLFGLWVARPMLTFDDEIRALLKEDTK